MNGDHCVSVTALTFTQYSRAMNVHQKQSSSVRYFGPIFVNRK